MNVLKYALIFIAGAGVGVGASAIFFKKKYDEFVKKSDEDLAKMDAYYREKLDKAYRPAEAESEVTPEEEEALVKAEKEIEKLTKPEKRKGSFGTDYTAYYYAGTDPAESEHPKEEEPIRVKQQPKAIRSSLFGTDGYSTKVLYYYTDDDALIPEGGTYDDIVDTDEVADTIGNALVKYGFADVANTDREIFLRNFDRKCDYQIIKVVGSLSEDYGG